MIIYSTPSCPRCKMLEEALRASGISYEERPLDVAAITECACDTGISVREAPLVHADGNWFFANQLFNPDGSLISEWRRFLCQTR